MPTYIYNVTAGPFDCFSPEKNEDPVDIPLRLFCRKSLSKYMAGQAESWFRVTRAGLTYYTSTFKSPYPFGKLDQILAPDYSHGAMENAGCVLYRDAYVRKDE
jgi:aminopeptidase N